MVGAGVLYDFLGGRGGGVGPHSQGGRELEGVGVVERGREKVTNVGVGPSAVLQEPQDGTGEASNVLRSHGSSSKLICIYR